MYLGRAKGKTRLLDQKVMRISVPTSSLRGLVLGLPKSGTPPLWVPLTIWFFSSQWEDNVRTSKCSVKKLSMGPALFLKVDIVEHTNGSEPHNRFNLLGLWRQMTEEVAPMSVAMSLSLYPGVYLEGGQCLDPFYCSQCRNCRLLV